MGIGFGTKKRPSKVVDEGARDIKYPTPSNGQQIYNERTNNIETYYSVFGLWLSSDMIVMIRPTASILVDRLVYVSGFFGLYPTVSYPTNTSTDVKTIGVVAQVGAAIDASRAYIAVAVSNQYYVDFGESIAVGEHIYAKTAPPNDDLGFAAGTAGEFPSVVGVALQNSGATPGKGTKVLIKVGLSAEIF